MKRYELILIIGIIIWGILGIDDFIFILYNYEAYDLNNFPLPDEYLYPLLWAFPFLCLIAVLTGLIISKTVEFLNKEI